MSATHFVFIALTFLLPLALCLASRRSQSLRFDRVVMQSLAALLLATEIGGIAFTLFIDGQPLDEALPMHLCDWALLATAAALSWQSQRCFEVAYFWGLAGTVQGLITPAIDAGIAVWRQAAFFVVHSGIIVGIMFLIFAKGMRPVPASIPRVLLWSGSYLAATLAVNALTGENYGFLAHPPPTPTLLDYFPANSLLYVTTITAVALAAFTLLYIPWLLADKRRDRRV